MLASQMESFVSAHPLDLGDLSNKAIAELIRDSARVFAQLESLGFKTFITAGCSIPKSVDLAVKKRDCTGLIIRREVLVWKALRQEFTKMKIIFGDYGVRGPHTNDGHPCKHTNGKIRYTVPEKVFLLRGHPIVEDGGAHQMCDLAEQAVKSPHWLGENFSWGDSRLRACSFGSFKGSTTTWIAIDTNHHLAYATQEAEEFDLSFVVAGAVKSLSGK